MLKKPQPGPNAATATAGTINSEVGTAEVVQEWVDVTMKTAVSLDPKAYIPEFWNQKTRPDGRIFGQARRTTVVPGVMERNALGSALVKFSRETVDDDSSSNNNTTHVLAGVTAEVGQPAGSEGDLKITLMPQNAVLESWLQRLLLQIMDLEQLGIVPAKVAFGLDIAIVVLNDDGNTMDACLLAAMAALRNTRLPPIVVQDGRVYTLEDESALGKIPSSLTSFAAKKLSLPNLPLPLTMGVTNAGKSSEEREDDNTQHWLVDPSKEEGMVCEGSITIVVNGLDMEQVLSLEYQGNISLTHSSLALAVQMAKGRAEDLLQLLQDDDSL